MPVRLAVEEVQFETQAAYILVLFAVAVVGLEVAEQERMNS